MASTAFLMSLICAGGVGTAVLGLPAICSPALDLVARQADQEPGDVRRLSVAELVARMPAESLIEVDGERRLEPIAAEIRRRAEEGLLSDDEWRAVLVASDAIHTRARWPAGERLALWIREPPWLRRTKITLRAIDPPLGEVSADNSTDTSCGTMWLKRIGKHKNLQLQRLPQGVTEILCTLTIDQGPLDAKGGLFGKGKLLRMWSGPYVLPIQAVHELEEVFQASSTPAEAEAVRASLGAYVRDAEVGFTSGLKLEIDGEYGELPVLVGLGLALEPEVRHVNRTISTLPTFVCSSGPWSRASDTDGTSLPFEFPDEQIPAAPSAPGWTVRITGRLDERLLTEWEVERWWDGSLELTLAEAMENAQRN